jgi:hypothetical protein
VDLTIHWHQETKDNIPTVPASLSKTSKSFLPELACKKMTMKCFKGNLSIEASQNKIIRIRPITAMNISKDLKMSFTKMKKTFNTTQTFQEFQMDLKHHSWNSF